MKPTTAQRFGSLGKSFASPSAAAAVIGAALLASDTSDTSETAWSPAAACLLPDVLPVAGTLLSYGGNRQLAAGGTVTHSGALTIGGDLTLPSYGRVTFTTGGGVVRTDGNDRIGLDYSGKGLQVGSGKTIGFSPAGTIDGNSSDAYFVRNSASSIGVKGAAGIDGALTTGAITASGAVNYPDGTIDARTSMNHALTLRATGAANAIRVLDSSGATKWSVDSVGLMTIGTLGYITFPHSTRLGDPNFVVTGGGTGIGLATSGSFFLATGGTTAAFIVGTTGSVTASGAIQETPTQSALDPTTTNIPSGKRQGWYNSTLSEFRDWVNIGGTLLKSAAYT